MDRSRAWRRHQRRRIIARRYSFYKNVRALDYLRWGEPHLGEYARTNFNACSCFMCAWPWYERPAQRRLDERVIHEYDW